MRQFILSMMKHSRTYSLLWRHHVFLMVIQLRSKCSQCQEPYSPTPSMTSVQLTTLNAFLICSRLPINVSFVPTQEREYNFNLQCMVKKKPTPIILNVKAEGFLITYTLHYEDRKGAMTELPTGKGTTRRIELGKVSYSTVVLYIGIMKVWSFQRVIYHSKQIKFHFLTAYQY